jgi:iron complex outermembrane recepter protein
MLRRRSLFNVLAVNLLAVSVAAAQDSSTDARFQLGTIETITVEGQKQASWTTPFQASVTAADLSRFERNDVSSALSLLPGVTVQNIGGRSEKLVYVRGFNSRQVPLFIDGVPVYVPYDGNFDLSRLLTFDVAEITVSKGYSSVLYGANALGGSINVVSRRPQEGFHAALRSGLMFDNGRDENSRNDYLSLENRQGNWYEQVNVSYSDQNSFTLPDRFIPRAAENGGHRENSDNHDVKVALKVGYIPNATDEYALSYQKQDGRKNTPPYAGITTAAPRFWRWPEYNKESLYYISRTSLSNSESLRLRVYYDTFANTLSSYDNATYTTQVKPFAFTSIYDDYSWGFSSELGSSRIANHALKAAMQYKRDVHREHNVGFPVKSMEDSVLSLGVEDAITLNSKLRWVVSSGYDQQDGRLAEDLQGIKLSTFPTATAHGWNAQTALTYSLNDRWSMHASVARRTRFPTMKDRYSYRLGTAIPNPALKPENAVNLELGVTGNLKLGDNNSAELSTAVFQSRIDDSIEAVTIAPTSCTSAPCSQLQNIGRQHNSGYELAMIVNVGAQLQLHANYTYLDRDNKSSPALLPLDTPQNKVFAFVQYSPIATVDLILSTQHESPRNSATNGTRPTTSYTTDDFKAVWHVTKLVQVEAGGRNLTDKLYAFEEGFPEPGRSWFMNVNAKW